MLNGILFANKLSELPEMSKYSQGTESYPHLLYELLKCLKIREIKEFTPILKKLAIVKLDVTLHD
jgi:hypothetical protein